MSRREGQVAFISGVARGQGRSHAVRLASEGAAIVGFDALTGFESVPYPPATEADLAETVAAVESVGGKIYAAQADVRDGESLASVAKEGAELFGPITAVIANAGISINYRPFWEFSDAEWREVIDVDLIGVWRTVSTVVPAMIEHGKGGAIVLTGSLTSIKQPPNLAPYNSAKSGLVGLVKTMANDLGKYNIRANLIAPTNVPTELLLGSNRMAALFRPDLEEPTLDDVKVAMSAAHLIPEPWVEAADVSNAVAWLVSDEARYVTGTVLPVDLGASSRW